jgi:hypothetical protein
MGVPFKGTRVQMLIAGGELRVLSPDGELLRKLTSTRDATTARRPWAGLRL